MLFNIFLLLITLTSSRIIHDEVGILNIEEEHSNKKLSGEEIVDYLRRRLVTSPNILSTSDKQSLLDAHNTWRSKTANGSSTNQPSGSNMNYLLWDEGLAAVATEYAKKCKWEHNAARSTDLRNYTNLLSFTYPSNGYVGENLYASSANSISSVSVLVLGVQQWYDEVTSYTYSTTWQSAAGHYTQVVWGSTRYVGCGYYTCPTGLAGITGSYWSDGAIIFACDYYPGGNWAGQYPYTSGTSCTACDADRTKCDNSLCGGCVSSNYNVNTAVNTVPNVCTNGLGVNLNSSSSSSTTSTTTTTTTTSTTTTTTTTTPSPTTTTTTTPSPTTATTTTTKTPTTAQPTTTTTTTKSPTSVPTKIPTKIPTSVPTSIPTTTTTTTAIPTTTTAIPTTTTTTTTTTTAIPTTTTTATPTTSKPTTKTPTSKPTTKAPTSRPTRRPTSSPTTRKGNFDSTYGISSARRRLQTGDEDAGNDYGWNLNDEDRLIQSQNTNNIIEELIRQNCPNLRQNCNVSSDLRIENIDRQCNVSFTISCDSEDDISDVDDYIETESFNDDLQNGMTNDINDNFDNYFIPQLYLIDTNISNYTQYFEPKIKKLENASLSFYVHTSTVSFSTLGGGGVVVSPGAPTSTFPSWATGVIAGGGAVAAVGVGGYVYKKRKDKKNKDDDNKQDAMVQNDSIQNKIVRQPPPPPSRPIQTQPEPEPEPEPEPVVVPIKTPVKTQASMGFAKPATHSNRKHSTNITKNTTPKEKQNLEQAIENNEQL